MKTIAPALIFACLAGFGVQAIADDAPAPSSSLPSASMSPTPSHKQFMKDCMTKAKAANNGTSVQDMRKACHDQLKSSMGTAKDPVAPAN